MPLKKKANSKTIYTEKNKPIEIKLNQISILTQTLKYSYLQRLARRQYRDTSKLIVPAIQSFKIT